MNTKAYSITFFISCGFVLIRGLLRYISLKYFAESSGGVGLI
jgi:hypothetical protein